MDILTFIAEIAKAAAWPAAAVTIAVLFRQQLRELMSRVRKGKVGPAEFEFEERIRELESEAAQLQLPKFEQRVPPIPATTLVSDPRSTIMTAWLRVEESLNALAIKHNLYNALIPPNSPYNMNALRKAGVVSADLVSLYRDLRSLRNNAAHDLEFSPSADAVNSYVHMANELDASLRQLANEA
ncbi:MAG: hypothetical protein Q7T57_00080 [Dehalococcoidales bacterium]|nr:hypothetical protein [Dehalococcoidales bacterium]